MSTVADELHAFTTPVGHVCLVKSFVANNIGLGTSHVILAIEAALPIFRMNAVDEELASTAISIWDGSIALNEGDSVLVYTQAISTAVWVSGVILAGSAQFQPGSRRLPTTEPLPAGFRGRPRMPI
jgi:hypothetical protein